MNFTDFSINLDIGSFFTGLATSLLTTFIWKSLTLIIQYRPSNYPDLRGRWDVKYTKNKEQVTGDAYFKRQFGKKIRGTYTYSCNDHLLEFKTTGVFFTGNSMQLTFCPKNKKRFTDFVVGLASVDNLHTTITSGTASFDVDTGKPMVIYATWKKKN